MRLTLRTLLAFMDDILDSDDHKQLSHKIETSDFATELIHRSRDTVRRLRLGAPDLLEPQEVIEDSSWIDPNTVAEYLDNTLVVENVAEYERVCLESDLNLAEVASCHHILTMVLGEPAEVDEKVRRRLYGLPERSAGSSQLRIERAHGEADQAKESYQQEVPLAHGAASETGQTAAVPRGAETGVPDYLKEAARSRRRNRLWLLATAALVCVIGYFAWDALIPPKLPSDLAGTDPAALIPEVKISGSKNLAGDGVVGDDRQGEALMAEVPEAAGGGHAAGARATAEQPDSEAPLHVPATAPSTPTSAAQVTSEAPPFAPGIQGGEPQEQSMQGEPGPAESGLSARQVPAPGQGPVASSAAVLPPEGSSTVSTAGEDAESAVPVPDEEALEHEKPAGSGDLNLTEETPILSGEMAISGEAAASGEGGTEELVHLPTDASSLRAASTAGSEPAEGGAMSTATQPTGEGSRAPITSSPGTSSPGTSSPGNEVEPSGTVSDSPAREAEEIGPIQVGNYLGNNDVFVRFDPQRGAWVRMPPRSNLFTGERLLTLPKFRTQVVLAGLNLSLSGGTQILLLTDVAFLGNDTGFSRGRGIEAGHDDLLLELVYGRILFSAGLNGSGVVLKVGDLVCWLQMGGSAGLAVEVNRQFVPGRDAEKKPAPIVATWYLTSGKLQLSVLDGANPGPAQTIGAPATWSFVDGVIGMPQVIDELPAWVDREPVTQTERRALTVLDDELAPDQPVGIRLLELNDRRQREVRTLAAQCSLYVGEFEPFVKALNDDQQKAAWKTLIDMLRQAIVLSPDAASQLREAFVMRRGEAAAEELMQMVRGYDQEAIGLTPEAVKNGALSKLIGWLDHDSLDYRVLASFNLQEITGKSIGYRPEYNAKQRQRGIRTWRKRLESGELLPVQ